MRKILIAAALLMMLMCGGCAERADNNTLIYASGDYTRINPALDEHGEINLLIFNGLTAHNANNDVVPALAKSWTFDSASNTYTFVLEDGVTWQDGAPFTADDVAFTIHSIMNPENGSEIASNYEDVTDIIVDNARQIRFKLSAPNAAFPDYMSVPILPKHLLEGKDLKTDSYFRHPIGTGPYEIETWNAGEAIIMRAYDDYFQGRAHIDTVIFKIVPDDSAKALQLRSGEVNFAQLPPKEAQSFKDDDAFNVITMQTSDYRGVMYNFASPFFKENKDIIPALNYGVDREAIVKSVLLGQGSVAYGPLQRNIFNFEEVERYTYDPQKAEAILKNLGCVKHDDGFYYRNGKKLAFTLNSRAGDALRLDLAQVYAGQMKAIGVDVTVEVPAKIDWQSQEAFVIGWGSPFDADDHTYKVFGTDKGNNFSAYSNAEVDAALKKARETENPELRAEYYKQFQQALVKDPAFTFICYVDADYVGAKGIAGYTPETILGHHGVGIFWNIKDWIIQD